MTTTRAAAAAAAARAAAPPALRSCLATSATKAAKASDTAVVTIGSPRAAEFDPDEPSNQLSPLSRGEATALYPGGVREAFKSTKKGEQYAPEALAF